MKREFLTSLGIEDKNIIDSIMSENGKDIESAKSAYADYDSIKEQLKTANSQIEEFGKLDVEGIRKTADEYKAKYEQSVKDAEAKIGQIRFDNALENALTSSKAKNAKAVKALLDMNGLKYNEGKIIGLDEQLKTIREENAYMFDSSEPSPESPKPKFSGGAGNPGSHNSLASARAIMGLPEEK